MNKFICPIGFSCYCSMILRMLGLQNKSLPFDYSASELDDNKDKDITLRVECILNGFDKFIEETDLIQTNRQTVDNVNLFVINKRTKLHYVHDFPIAKDFHSSYINFYQKMMHKIDNFNNGINCADSVYFIWMQQIWNQNKWNSDKPSTDLLLNLSTKLEDKFNKPINWLVFDNTPTMEENHIQETNKGNVTRVALNQSYLNKHFYSHDFDKYMVKDLCNYLIKKLSF